MMFLSGAKLEGYKYLWVKEKIQERHQDTQAHTKIVHHIQGRNSKRPDGF